jgi:pheromone shutdown protein TraB
VKDFFGAFSSGRGAVGDNLLGAAMKAFYGFFKLSGLDPGAEFKEAVKEADALAAEVIAGDRDVRETLKRVRANVSFADVMMMMSGSVKPGGPPPPEGMDAGFDDIERVVENLKTRRHIRQMREFMAHQMPKLSQVFVDERDEIMTQVLLKCRAERVVAVVGMAHMDGIERRWNEAQKRLRISS